MEVVQLLRKIRRKVDDNLNQKGDEPLKLKELKQVTKYLYKNKSPGLDGIPVEFYQNFQFALEWLLKIIEELCTKKETDRNNDDVDSQTTF